MEQQYDPNTYTYPFQLTKTLHRDPYDDLLPTNPENSQKGKIVIITGAYGGIGAVCISTVRLNNFNLTPLKGYCIRLGSCRGISSPHRA